MKYTKSFGTWKRALLPGDVSKLAREVGWSERKSKLTPVRFFWGLVLGFREDAKKTMAGLARFISLISGVVLSRQALHKRLTKEAVCFLESCYRLLLQRVLARGSALLEGKLGLLGRFKDLAVVDSTSFRLADRLASRFPACRSNVRKAAVKIHACMSLAWKHAERIRISAERVHDRRGALIGRWVRDRLVTFDLGYFDYGLFRKIVEWGGAFCTRLKETATGEIIAVRAGCRKRSIGKALNRVDFFGSQVDLDVRFGAGKRAATFRVIGLWDRRAQEYHWYATSLEPMEFSPVEVGQIYALRWQIEMMFKEWKTLARIGQVASRREEVVRVLIYAALCAMLLSRLAVEIACRTFCVAVVRISTYLTVGILATYARELAGIAVGQRCREGPRVFHRFLEAIALHAKHPNKTTAMQLAVKTN